MLPPKIEGVVLKEDGCCGLNNELWVLDPKEEGVVVLNEDGVNVFPPVVEVLLPNTEDCPMLLKPNPVETGGLLPKIDEVLGKTEGVGLRNDEVVGA